MVKVFKKNKNYNVMYRLKLLLVTLCFFTLGLLAGKDLTIAGYIVFTIVAIITFWSQLKLIRLEKHIPK